MGCEGHNPNEFDNWISTEVYANLFYELLEDHSDPPILLVSGFYLPDGSVTLFPLFMVESGIPDLPQNAGLLIGLRDESGESLFQEEFSPSRYVYRDPLDRAELEYRPFAFSVPLSTDTEYLTISDGDEELVEVPIYPRLLQDAINLIPDGEFSKLPQQRRAALLNKVGAFQQMLVEGNRQGAILKLQNDIIKHLVGWLREDYSPPSPLEYSRAEIIQLAHSIEMNLEAQ